MTLPPDLTSILDVWRDGMEWHPGIYKECLRRSLWETCVHAPLDRVVALRPISQTHAALATSLAASEHDLAEQHPYSAFVQLLQHYQPDLSPAVVYGMRRETFESVRAVGVQTPLDLFFDDSGLYYFHGHHRLAFAAHLGLQSLPVRMSALSSALAELAGKVFALYRDERKWTVYQPLEHPLFSLFPVQECNSCWDAKIATVLAATKGWEACVEVGAHFGGLTRALRTAGVDCLAIDVAKFYREVQLLLEATGHARIPYATMDFRQLAQGRDQCRFVSIGLWHHFMGKPDLWEQARGVILPWMKRCVPEAIIELSLLDTYQGASPACAVRSDAEVKAFWYEHGYAATLIRQGALRRDIYHLRRAGS